MKKFEYQADTGYFAIDPSHLVAGLRAAEEKKHTAIRVMAMDYRDTRLGFDPAVFRGRTWIRKLVLDEDLKPERDGLGALGELTRLEELNMPAWVDLDFSRFGALSVLVLAGASRLDGLEHAGMLRQLYLIDWKGTELPEAIARITAPEVRISACRRLASVDRLLEAEALRDLTLQDLPQLRSPFDGRSADGLVRLNVERVGFRDFGSLASKTLEELELFTTFESLSFLERLPALRRLYLWECVDGDMSPVLAHPALREIHLDKNRRHYSHKEEALQAALSARR